MAAQKAHLEINSEGRRGGGQVEPLGKGDNASASKSHLGGPVWSDCHHQVEPGLATFSICIVRNLQVHVAGGEECFKCTMKDCKTTQQQSQCSALALESFATTAKVHRERAAQ